MGSQDPQRSQTFPGTLRRAVGMRPQTEGRLQHLSGSGPWIRRTHKGEGPVLLCGQKPTGAWGEGGYSLTTLRACPARASEKRRVTPPNSGPARPPPTQAPGPSPWLLAPSLGPSFCPCPAAQRGGTRRLPGPLWSPAQSGAPGMLGCAPPNHPPTPAGEGRPAPRSHLGPSYSRG